jgi:hypothetical protein
LVEVVMVAVAEITDIVVQFSISILAEVAVAVRL